MRKISIANAIALIITFAFLVFIAGAFLYQLGSLNARTAYQGEFIQGHIGGFNDWLQVLNLTTQQDISLYSYYQVFVSYGALAISSLALAGLLISLRQTQTSLETSRELGVAQATCYVHAAKATWGDGGKIILHVKNSGATPASHFAINCRAYIETRGRVSSNLNFDPSPIKTWSALAANSELTVALDEINFRQVALFGEKEADQTLVFVAVGTIYYVNVFGQTFRTEFAFYTDTTKKTAKFRRPTARLDVHTSVKTIPNY